MEEVKEFIPETVQLADDQMRQMVVAIRKARAEKHLSYQAIVDGCEKNGDYVSMSSVRRVCAEGSEKQKFRYEATLRPIARFVLGLDEDTPASEVADQDGPAANELLRVIIGIKEDAIADLKQAATDKDRQIEYLLEDLKQLKLEVSQLKTGIRWRTGALLIVISLLILVAALLIASL